MGREAAATRSKLRRGLWSPEEDEKLYNHIIRYGVGCWSSVPKLAGLERCGKSCRLRWINYLRPDLKRGSFSQEEEDLIISLHKILGNRWSQIASQLPGRTDNEIKNFWNSCIKKKLRQQGIDPATHKPLNDDDAVATDDNAGAVAAPHYHQDDNCAASSNNNNKQQQMQIPSTDDHHCFGISSDDPLAPHSPTVSFDPLSVTNVPAAMQQASSYGSFRSGDNHLCDYGGGVDVVSDAAYTGGGGGGGDSSSNSNGTWTCGGGANVVGGEPMPPHVVDMFGRDAYHFGPAKYSPWHQHQQQHLAPARIHDHNVGGGAAGFPIRRDLPDSCFDLARSALEDEFSVDFL